MTTLNILTSRRNQITKTVDVLDIFNINPVSQIITKQGDLTFKGGIENLGTFDEGKCIKLNFKNGKSYIVCSFNESKITDISNYIFQM